MDHVNPLNHPVSLEKDLLHILYTQTLALFRTNPMAAAASALQLLLEPDLDAFRRATLHDLVSQALPPDASDTVQHACASAGIYRELAADGKLGVGVRKRLSRMGMAARVGVGCLRRLRRRKKRVVEKKAERKDGVEEAKKEKKMMGWGVVWVEAARAEEVEMGKGEALIGWAEVRRQGRLRAGKA